MARPSEFPIKKLIGFDQETLDAVDRFRAETQPIPNQSEAMRRIIREWLESHGYLKPGN